MAVTSKKQVMAVTSVVGVFASILGVLLVFYMPGDKKTVVRLAGLVASIWICVASFKGLDVAIKTSEA